MDELDLCHRRGSILSLSNIKASIVLSQELKLAEGRGAQIIYCAEECRRRERREYRMVRAFNDLRGTSFGPFHADFLSSKRTAPHFEQARFSTRRKSRFPSVKKSVPSAQRDEQSLRNRAIKKHNRWRG